MKAAGAGDDEIGSVTLRGSDDLVRWVAGQNDGCRGDSNLPQLLRHVGSEVPVAVDETLACAREGAATRDRTLAEELE